MKAILVIDMPEGCNECPCVIDICFGTLPPNDYYKKKPSWCPLKPLPEGHGDLIDRKDLIENGLCKGFCDWYDEIKMADAIIESDGGKTE